MARTLPTTVVSAMMAPQTDALPLWLLTIRHASISTIRVVNNTESVTSNSQTYLPMPFSIVLPPDDDEVSAAIRVSVANVSLEVMTAARTVAGKTAAKADLYLIDYDTPDTQLLAFEDYDVRNLRGNASVVTFDMTLESFTNEPYPAMTFTPGRFPGMF